MSAGLRWREATAEIRDAVDAWWRSADVAPTAGHASGWRTITRVPAGDAECLVKHYRVGAGVRRVRERIKAALRVAAPWRELRGLRRLRAAGVPAPAPLGLATCPGGDALVVMEAVEGPSLWAVLEEGPSGTRDLLRAVAELVRALHAAGLAHGDLHPGNVVVGRKGPVLIDLQRSRRARPGGRAQLRDLGLLDHSLRQLGVSRAERVRVLQRALGVRDAARETRRARTLAASRAAGDATRRHARTRARQAARREAAGSA